MKRADHESKIRKTRGALFVAIVKRSCADRGISMNRTTLRYLHFVPDQLQEKMRMFSPLAGIDAKRQGSHRDWMPRTERLYQFRDAEVAPSCGGQNWRS